LQEIAGQIMAHVKRLKQKTTKIEERKKKKKKKPQTNENRAAKAACSPNNAFFVVNKLNQFFIFKPLNSLEQ
jgi:hypothetical protein